MANSVSVDRYIDEIRFIDSHLQMLGDFLRANMRTEFIENDSLYTLGENLVKCLEVKELLERYFLNERKESMDIGKGLKEGVFAYLEKKYAEDEEDVEDEENIDDDN